MCCSIWYSTIFYKILVTTSLTFYFQVHETLDFVTDLVNHWPVELWGEFNAESIGVVLPYMDHVTVLRKFLKEKGGLFREVTVERVFNVQGRCVILIT